MKITQYHKCFCKKLDGSWEWICPVWFTDSIFADCTIESACYLETEADAAKDLIKIMKKFGVTKRTKKAWWLRPHSLQTCWIPTGKS